MNLSFKVKARTTQLLTYLNRSNFKFFLCFGFTVLLSICFLFQLTLFKMQTLLKFWLKKIQIQNILALKACCNISYMYKFYALRCISEVYALVDQTKVSTSKMHYNVENACINSLGQLSFTLSSAQKPFFVNTDSIFLTQEKQYRKNNVFFDFVSIWDPSFHSHSSRSYSKDNNLNKTNKSKYCKSNKINRREINKVFIN